MATDADMLAGIRADALARLKELDAVPIDQRAFMTYADAGQSYDYDGYRAGLQAKVEWTYKMGQEAVNSRVKTQAPFTFHELH